MLRTAAEELRALAESARASAEDARTSAEVIRATHDGLKDLLRDVLVELRRRNESTT
jgi:hypothetical protein